MQGKKKEKANNFDISLDEDLNVLNSLLDKLSEKYLLSAVEIVQKLKHNIVPLCIFNRSLSPLESVCKYLREELNYTNQDTAKALNRDMNTTWQAYNSSKKKYPRKFAVKFSNNDFDVRILSDRKLSILESIVSYLRNSKKLTYHEIGVLLKRDDRTIWTCNFRANKK